MINFNDTANAFAGKSDKDLRDMHRLFSMMGSPFLVNWGSKITLLALNLGLPIQSLIKATVFKQFCGGTNLQETLQTVDYLDKYDTLTVLDYGAEGKESEEDFDKTMQENLRAIDFAQKHAAIAVVSTKITGMMRFALLEKMDKKETLQTEESAEYERALNRIDAICKRANESNVCIYIDAEESWIQDTIDHIVNKMMEKYNRKKAIVYNTFQLYRHDRLAFLKKSFEEAKQKGYILGAKLVRGAYMEKERARAAEMGYPSPIQPDKQATDRDYNAAVRFCVMHYMEMSSCVASHNADSSFLQAKLMEENGIDLRHPNLQFCQLYGMSDNLTFNLAKAGYTVSKYVPYGSVHDVIPYLIRRARENTSVTGDVSRELSFVKQEIKRRKSN